MNIYSFSRRSQENIASLHPDLQRVLSTALVLGVMDFSVISGGRTDTEQKKLYEQGRTKGDRRPIITWTMKSRHLIQPDGYAHAFDVVPYPVDWYNIKDFAILGALMYRAAYIEKVEIEWGGFFERPDYGHFQLP